MKHMTRWTGLLLLWALPLGYGLAQSKASVSNVRIQRDGIRYQIMYDLDNATRLDSVYLSAESLQKGVLPVRSTQGNVGLGQTPGRNKTIVWDVASDADIEGDSVTVTIGVVPSVRAAYIGGGPANALISAALPGIGNIFVQPRHKVGLRPLVTATYAGLLIYGLAQRAESNRQYARYKDERILNLETAQPFYDKANAANRRYLVAARTAALIWAVDVTATLLRGLRNDTQRRRLVSSVSWHPTAQTPLIGLRYRW